VRLRSFVVAAAAFAIFSTARPMHAAVPQFGAQVWIEPGQSPAEIDSWFATLETSRMPVARLFMMWSYLEPKRDTWDWSLYDAAFRAAEKHHIAIVATLTPSGPPSWLGGDDSQGVGVNTTGAQQAEAAAYIGRVVERYRGSPALDTWLLLNEPGQAPVASELATASYSPWLEKKYATIADVNRAWGTNYASFAEIKGPAKDNHWNPSGEIDWTTYWQSFQTSQLAWMANEVRQHDPRHPLHLNPHALVGNLSALSDDLPTWRRFLDTLGCSIHPAWHFGLLPRDQFALGVSYVNDLVSGAIEPKPHWVTELQGGNNIHSGALPMEPSANDTAQWLWTSVGAGAERTIFWLLNARRAGREAGEWSLLDFDQQPSRRMTVSTEIVNTLQKHADFFAEAKPAVPDITVLVSLETMTYQLAFAKPDDVARDRNQQLLELLGIYKAIAQDGPPPRVKHFDDYDWTSPGKSRVVVVPDARVLTEAQMGKLLVFAKSGGTLLITGLSGLYDEHGMMWALSGRSPLSQVTGASLKEVHMLGSEISVPVRSGPLPSRMWVSSVAPKEATALASLDGETVATERHFPGGGWVIWIPSPIGMGAWTGDATPLAKYLRTTLSATYASLPFTQSGVDPACFLRVMKNGRSYLTVLTNGSAETTRCALHHDSALRSEGIWASEAMAPEATTQQGETVEVTLGPRGTAVDLWH
jgi:beta-galactosidase